MRIKTILMSALLAASGPYAACLDDGLVAYYPFDNKSANDASGNGHHGQNVGVTFVDGPFGKAARFDGNAYVQMPNHAQLQIEGDLTLSAWVRMDSGYASRLDPEFKIVTNSYSIYGGYDLALHNDRGGVIFGRAGDLNVCQCDRAVHYYTLPPRENGCTWP